MNEFKNLKNLDDKNIALHLTMLCYNKEGDYIAPPTATQIQSVFNTYYELLNKVKSAISPKGKQLEP